MNSESRENTRERSTFSFVNFLLVSTYEDWTTKRRTTCFSTSSERCLDVALRCNSMTFRSHWHLTRPRRSRKKYPQEYFLSTVGTNSPWTIWWNRTIERSFANTWRRERTSLRCAERRETARRWTILSSRIKLTDRRIREERSPPTWDPCLTRDFVRTEWQNSLRPPP